jgi:hypothetical protein
MMQLLGAPPGTEAIRAYVFGEQFSAWYGLLPCLSAPVASSSCGATSPAIRALACR